MTAQQTTNEGFDQAIAAIPTCALDEAGVRGQRARYNHLAPSVTNLEREPEAVVVEFREDFDRGTLAQALAVERECCPFFQFAFDESRRLLRVTVRESDQLPALEAMAYALGTRHCSMENRCDSQRYDANCEQRDRDERGGGAERPVGVLSHQVAIARYSVYEDQERE